jgi:hypothetical protein
MLDCKYQSPNFFLLELVIHDLPPEQLPASEIIAIIGGKHWLKPACDQISFFKNIDLDNLNRHTYSAYSREGAFLALVINADSLDQDDDYIEAKLREVFSNSTPVPR